MSTVETLQLIDTHVHYWDLSLKKNAWLLSTDPTDSFLGNYSGICKNNLPNNMLLNAKPAELIGSVHIQAGWDRPDITGEITWITQLAKQYNTPIKCISYTDITSHSLEDSVAKHVGFEAFCGFRQIISWHKDQKLSNTDQNYAYQDRFHYGLETLNKNQLIFEVQAYPDQLTQLLPTIKRCQNITFVIEHCGLPIFTTQKDFEHWQLALKKLAQLKNVVLKISGVMMCANRSTFYYSATNILQACISSFNKNRIVFGSNFPVESLYSSYALLPQLLQKISQDNEQLDLICFKNAITVYGFSFT